MIQTIFTLQARCFPSLDIQIAYVRTFLTESALAWFKDLINRNDQALESIDSFWSAFMIRFGNPLASEEKEALILTITQGLNERATDFNNRFRTLALAVPFNDEALKSLYHKALNKNEERDALESKSQT